MGRPDRPKSDPQTAGPRPGDFPIGSPESRAAARMLLDSPPPGAPIRYRILGRAEYKAHIAAQNAGKVFPCGILPAKSASSEDWVRECKEDMAELAAELERERAEKLAREGRQG